MILADRRNEHPDQVVDGVDVWYASYSSLLSRVAELSESLSPTERARAATFRVPDAALRFAAGRGLVRALLARYLAVDARSLQLTGGGGGKPRLAGGDDAERLRFNVSHSGDLLCCAVTWDREVGADVELIRPVRRQGEVVDLVLSRADRRRWWRLAEEQRPTAFFTLWTRHEAVLKAAGAGLARPLPHRDPARDWSVHTLDTIEGYAGALAVERPRHASTSSITSSGS